MVSPRERSVLYGAAAGMPLTLAFVALAHLLAPPPPPPQSVVASSASEAAAEPAPTVEADTPPSPPPCAPEPPLATRNVDLPPPVELARLVQKDPARLGAASIGSPTRGRLWGAVELIASRGIAPSGDQPFGTEAVVRAIERAVREVRRCFRDTPRLHVGDISRKEGGRLEPHKSHQSGLDADIGYYYVGGAAWYRHASAANLDRARTWALVRALIDGGNVEIIFMDAGVQRLLREHAETLGVDNGRLDQIFADEQKRQDVLIRHERGHDGHFHVRFRDPASVALGLRLAPMLQGRTPAAGPATSADARIAPPTLTPRYPDD